MAKHAMIWDRARLVYRISRIIADRLPPDFLKDCIAAVVEDGVKLITIDTRGVPPEKLEELISKEILGRDKFVEWLRRKLEEAKAGRDRHDRPFPGQEATLFYRGKVEALEEVLRHLGETP